MQTRTQCPLLCKEFVVDAWQIYYARIKGADAILLIAAVLPDLDIKYMIKICKLLGMTALVEVKHFDFFCHKHLQNALQCANSDFMIVYLRHFIYSVLDISFISMLFLSPS